MKSRITNDGGGGVTNSYGLYSQVLSSVSLTNGYGLYLDDVTGATNSYGVYQVGVNDKNYFAGSVGIGTTAPTSTLDVNGGVKVGNLKVGSGSWVDGMGICEINSVAITNSPGTYTCTGIPGSDIAVHCSATQAMTTPGSNGLNCRSSGVAGQVICNTLLANTVSMNWMCMWMYKAPVM